MDMLIKLQPKKIWSGKSGLEVSESRSSTVEPAPRPLAAWDGLMIDQAQPAQANYSSVKMNEI